MPKQAGKSTPDSSHVNDTLHFHKLHKLFVTGDFDGDGQQDTIVQGNFSRRTQVEIDSCPDPFQNDWDLVVNWFYNQEADVYITLHKHNSDSLHLGMGQGLYCLINIGDNNSDGKDEVALVSDYCDFSRVNSCKIFGLCKGRWTPLKQFSINESAFDFTDDTLPAFREIKGFLVKANQKWRYTDYDQNGNNTEAEVGKMKVLKTGSCQ